ncbi:hypothetical protein HII31_00102 [Pseudocercospora fuligena]|uniref:Uncharacterized protein n=1 Tax=Pseudocercospora fuligena TaxID=685502 RepID=A0A8H6RVW3_9PEZI|nr:hypothetical protein HII31_00102 [Pseudocercospora fuligena]
MAPGQQIHAGDLSYSVAKKVCNAQDFERLACAFLSATTNVDFDANKAAREFGGCKPDSFKRAIWVICKKIKEAKENGVGGDEGEGEVKKTKGRKRKADGDEDEDGGETKKKKGSGGGKKTKKVKEEPGLESRGVGDGEDSDGLGLL